jgi:hypothetical protein
VLFFSSMMAMSGALAARKARTDSRLIRRKLLSKKNAQGGRDPQGGGPDRRCEGAKRAACLLVSQIRAEDHIPQQQQRQAGLRPDIDRARRSHPADEGRNREGRNCKPGQDRSTDRRNAATDEHLGP